MKRKPATQSLPPVRVEPRLHEALARIAEREGRSMSSVIRGLLRGALDKRGWD